MIIWFCPSCREEVEHNIEETNTKRYQDHKIITCQECGEKHMIPEGALEREQTEQEMEVEQSVASDGGFDRDVDGSCESGVCPTR